MDTLAAMMSDADICRANGWGPGTKLVGTECGEEWSHTDTIVITAVGEKCILARAECHGREGVWTLTCRSWRVAP